MNWKSLAEALRLRPDRGRAGFVAVMLSGASATMTESVAIVPTPGEELAEIPPTDQLSPAEILELAAKAQAAESDPKLASKDLRLEVQMMVRYRRDQTDITCLAERRFKAPHFIYTRLEAESITKEGFDGTRGWIWKEGATSYYTGPESVEDRRKLQRDIDETALLGKVFFLSNLGEEVESWERLKDVDARGGATHVIEGISRKKHAGFGTKAPSGDAEAEKPRLRLFLRRDSHELAGCRWIQGDQNLQLWFSGHRKNAEGVIVPMHIEILENDEKKPSKTIDVQSLSFRPEFSEKSFCPG